MIKEGWQNRDTGKKSDPRLQFNSFQLLHDVMESYAKKLSIQFNINDIKEERIHRIKELLKMHEGNQMLNFVVYDNKEQIKQFEERKIIEKSDKISASLFFTHTSCSK